MTLRALCLSSYPSQRKSRRYYPTRLAINLSSGVSGAGGSAHQPGFIVVETNYRLYAYTGEVTEALGEQVGVGVGREGGRRKCQFFFQFTWHVQFSYTSDHT